jgi:uncharacterized protein
MMEKKKIIFVHGYGLNVPLEDGDWPYTLARAVAKYGFDFQVLHMPEPVYPEVHEWVDFLVKQKIKVDLNTYFIGHSLGCITIARYFEKLPLKAVAGGCIFVSGFCLLPAVPLLTSFCALPLDYSVAKKHAREFVVITSDDDHLIPPADAREFADKFGARLITEHGLGHFVTGVSEIPSLLNVILEMDQMSKEVKEMNELKQVKDSGAYLE